MMTTVDDVVQGLTAIAAIVGGAGAIVNRKKIGGVATRVEDVHALANQQHDDLAGALDAMTIKRDEGTAAQLAEVTAQRDRLEQEKTPNPDAPPQRAGERGA